MCGLKKIYKKIFRDTWNTLFFFGWKYIQIYENWAFIQSHSEQEASLYNVHNIFSFCVITNWSTVAKVNTDVYNVTPHYHIWNFFI